MCIQSESGPDDVSALVLPANGSVRRVDLLLPAAAPFGRHVPVHRASAALPADYGTHRYGCGGVAPEAPDHGADVQEGGRAAATAESAAI